MIFEKQENGIRQVELNDWKLILTPVNTEKGKAFIAQYYENGKEELKFAVSSTYDTYLCKEQTQKNDAIIYKVIAFFDVFKRMDELEDFEKSLK